MKLTIILAVGAIVALTDVAGDFWYLRTVSIEASLKFDITDPNKKADYMDEVHQIIHSAPPRAGIIIGIGPVTDYNRNRTVTRVLPPVFWFNNITGNRNDEINDFEQTVLSDIQQLFAHDTGRSQSKVYVSLKQEANRLAQSPAAHKLLVLNSDAQENEENFNIYLDADRTRLDTDRQGIIRLLENNYGKFENLKGVQVDFIYEAQSHTDEKYFECMSGLFSEMLIKAGAGPVYIGPNLITPQNN